MDHPESQTYRNAFRDSETFATTVDLFNQLLGLPYNIPITHEECGTANAFYNPNAQKITLCYELLSLIGETFDDSTYTDEEYARAVSSAWLFIFFHELGHALVDAYDLPITGQEEDAVDDLATLIWIDLGDPDAALYAAFFWYSLDDGDYSTGDFADEHSLNKQRFFQTMCTVYGSAPEDYGWLVDDGHLPSDRAERCPGDYEQKDDSWSELLDPWMKDTGDADGAISPIEFPDSLPRPSQPQRPESTQSGTLATNQDIDVPAGETYYHGAELEKTAVLNYAFQIADTSTLDVGIIQYEDLDAYRNGEQVETWAYRSEVQQANAEAELSAGTYAFVLYCRNSYFDCDLSYSLSIEDPGSSSGDSSEQSQTQHHANQEQIAIGAGEVYAHRVDLSDGGAISYWFEVLDTSTLDVGIMRAEDVDKYRSGQSVDVWAYHTEVQWAEDGAELAPDEYAFFLDCLNSFNNCDLEYSLASTS